MSLVHNIVGGAGGGKPSPTDAVLSVAAPSGSTVTIKKGTGTSVTPNFYLDGTDTDTFFFYIKAENFGEWTVTATLGGQTAEDTINILDNVEYSVELVYIKIYGITRDTSNSSPEWTRTDDAIGFTFVPSVGNATIGHSSFDNCYPWKNIEIVTLETGDEMVKIPKFWYQRIKVGDVETIKIATANTEGFALHPAFQHNDSVQDYIYVSRYMISSGYVSSSGKAPLEGPKATMRTSIMGKGSGWGMLDITTVSAIQMLILVECANNNVQTAIGHGVDGGSGTTKVNSGSTDSMTYKTGSASGTEGKSACVYRGIENFWGNDWQLVDGININSGNYYVCNDQSKYVNGSASTSVYDRLSYVCSTSENTIYHKYAGYDSSFPWAMLATNTSGGSTTTFMCDPFIGGKSWVWFGFGSSAGRASGEAGIFTQNYIYEVDWSGTTRLVYIPS